MNPDSLNKLWLNTNVVQKILNERKKKGFDDDDNDDEAEDEIDDVDSDEEC